MSTARAYAELGLEPGANEAEVKAAWRRLVSQWHPDRNNRSVAVDKMQRINQAFETLRRAGFGHGGVEAEVDRDADPDVDEPAEAPPPPPPTVSRKVKLTLEEAAAGCTKVLRGKLTETCASCAGAGEHIVAGACEPCRGSGSIRQRGWYGLFSTFAECEACAGKGTAARPCEDCAGQGEVELRKYSTTVRFPHGVRDGDQLHVDASRLRGELAPVNLDIHVELAPHPLFTLEADGTVHCEVPVDGFVWVGNRAVDVPTLGGLQRLQLSRNQLSYRLAGQGFPVRRRGERGDQQITVVPIFPERFSTDQEILFDQLVATGTAANGQPSDPRLRRWVNALHGWDKNRR